MLHKPQPKFGYRPPVGRLGVDWCGKAYEEVGVEPGNLVVRVHGNRYWVMDPGDPAVVLWAKGFSHTIDPDVWVYCRHSVSHVLDGLRPDTLTRTRAGAKP